MEPDPIEPVDPRITAKRTVQLRRARAALYLLCEEVGAHNAVVLLKDCLREQLDRLSEATQPDPDGARR